jgi:GTP-binding protein HflX
MSTGLDCDVNRLVPHLYARIPTPVSETGVAVSEFSPLAAFREDSACVAGSMEGLDTMNPAVAGRRHSRMTQKHREDLNVVAERAVLVGVVLPGDHVDEHDPLRELKSLAETAGAQVVGELIQNRAKPNGRTYLGKGKVEELVQLVEMTKAALVIFDNDLAPSQIRAIEEDTKCKVLDRSELILDIFANRATTRSAQLQVEIAQLEYTYPRLRAMWSHLGQIVGGAPIGIGTRGPGEKQIEMDRRIVQRRLTHLKRDLAGVLERTKREVVQRNEQFTTVGIVGYTNAGKSTLFNRLTAGGAFAHSKLFATLATRVEKWELSGGDFVMLSDTVGFIRNLPHHLVASFRSTLEETVAARLLLVVVDASDADAEHQLETVFHTLDEIGAKTQPRVIVLNKIDQIPDRNAVVSTWLERFPNAIPISAVTGEGTEALAERVRTTVIGELRELDVALPTADGAGVNFLESRGNVLARHYEDGVVHMTVRLGRRHLEQLAARGARFEVNGQEGREFLKRNWQPNGLTSAVVPEEPPATDWKLGEEHSGTSGAGRTPPHLR